MTLRAVLAGMQQAFADTVYSKLNTSTKVVPTTGQTVSFANNSIDQTIYLNPAGVLASLTLTFPSEATSRIGQKIRFCTSQAVTLLTLNGATTIMNTVAALNSSDCFTFEKIDANVWVHA